MSMTSPRRRVGTISLYVGLFGLAAVTILPFWWVIVGSLRSAKEFRRDPGAWWPSEFSLANYAHLFAMNGFGRFVMNSVVTSGVSVAANIILASLAGYALAKLNFPGKRAVFVALIVAMMMPGTVTFVPQFVVAVNLGLSNTLAGIIVPFLVAPLNIFIVRQFANSVPEELLEAARIDGASELRIFFRIFLPLIGPAVAVVTIMSFLGAWNAFLWPLVIAQSDAIYTLPLGIATMKATVPNITDYGSMLAGAVVIMAPVLALFVFLQKYFIQGIGTAGLRG